jgi:hypothetical protein
MLHNSDDICVGRGNCGYLDNDSMPVVAIPQSLYNSNNGGSCNQVSC